MKLDLYRLCKLSFFWVLLAVFLLVNAGHLIFSQYGSYDYARLYTKQFEDTKEYDSVKIERIKNVVSDETLFKVYEMLSEERKEYEEYPAYLDMVEQNASSSLLFFDEGSFASRNAKKTLRAYAPVKDYNLVYEPSGGIYAFLQTDFTDCLILFVALFLCYYLVSRDKELTVFYLFGSTGNGYRKLIFKRLFLLFSVVTIVSVVLYLMNFCYYNVLYDWGTMGRSIQSVYGMKDFVYPFTVGQYIVFFLLCKWVALLFLSLLLYTIFVLIERPLYVSIFVGVAAVAEELMYARIDDNATVVLAKYVNAAAILHTDSIITIYRNMNLFNYPVSLLLLIGCVILISSFLCILLTSVGYQRMKQPREQTNHIINLWLKHRKRKCIAIQSLWYYEWYKLLYLQRVLFVLIGFIAICVVTFHPKQIYAPDLQEAQYKSYVTKLQGYPSSLKDNYLDAEKRLHHDLTMQLHHIDEQDVVTQYEVMQRIQEKEQIYKVDNLYQYVKARSNRQMVYDTGYQWLLGDRGTVCTLIILAALFFATILCTSGLFVSEQVNGVKDLLLTTYNGILNLSWVKHGIAIILYSFLYCALFGIRLVSIGIVYGYPLLGADANSMMMLSYIPDGWSIGLVLFMVHIWYYIVGYVMLRGILWVSKQSKTRMSAMLSSLGMALVLWLVLFGISFIV